MTSIFREKLSPQVYRDAVLEGRRFTGPEAFERGIVDALGGLPEALELIKERKLVGNGTSGVYSRLRDEMYRDTIGLLEKWGWPEEQRDEAEKQGRPRWSKL